MTDIAPYETWRDLLREVIRDPKDRQRIAGAIGVNPATLTRWSNRETNPRLDEIRNLFSVVPEVQPLLLQDLLGSIGNAPDFVLPSKKSILTSPEEGVAIPSRFYEMVLRAIRDAAPRFEVACNLIIPQALSQLDTQRLGMEIVIATCMPPYEGQKVRSLRQRIGQGSAPWKNNYLEEKNYFLGSESLPGYAIAQQHWMISHHVAEPHQIYLLKPLSSQEASMAAFPITLEGEIAGCLIASSTQSDHFTEDRLKLLAAYADLIRFGFRDTDFYPPSQIDLAIMPPFDVQRAYFTDLRKRIADLQNSARTSNQRLDGLQAERIVRKQIEEELCIWQHTHMHKVLASDQI